MQKPKERFEAIFEYKGEFDIFPATYYGTPEIDQQLMDYFSINSYQELLEMLGDDFRRVGPEYIGPELKKYEDGSWEGLWGERYTNWDFGNGTYPEAVYLPFKDVTNVEQLKNFRFPSADWYDYSNILSDCGKISDYVVVCGNAGVMDFMNGIARCRGVEQVLLDVGTEEPVFLELMERRHRFFMGNMERILKAANGKIDILHIGEDYGSQEGLLISPRSFEKLFAPKLKEYIDLGHKYGAKVMMHCCGSCRDIISVFIDLGLDILEEIQPDAAGMDTRELHDEFYGKIAFCGSISAQHLLPFGTVEDVVREVNLRKELFSKGGMIIAPDHNIQAGTPIENIIAMYKTIGSLKENKIHN